MGRCCASLPELIFNLPGISKYESAGLEMYETRVVCRDVAIKTDRKKRIAMIAVEKYFGKAERGLHQHFTYRHERLIVHITVRFCL